MAAALPIGLIGLGKHGARYLSHVQADFPDLEVAALSRQNEVEGKRQASDIGARFHRDHRELVADPSVEAVMAVVPPTEHAAIVEAAIDARKPILVEKPFATTAAEAWRLAKRIEDAGLPCLVGQTLRFSGVVTAVRERLEQIGRVSQMVFGQSFEPSRLDWLDDPDRSGGGNILHTGIHMFDLVRLLSGGEATSAFCIAERVSTEKTEDSFSASLEVEASSGKVLASVTASRATQSRYGEIRVIGEKGQISADHVHGSVQMLVGREFGEVIHVPDVPTVRETIGAFERVARGGASPIPAREGAAAVAIADACYESMRHGGRATVQRG